jgi:hypothetical protein
MPAYVSVFDRPKRGKGRPKTCKRSDEKKKQRAINIKNKYHNDNYEKCVLRQRLYNQQIDEQ